MKHVPIPDDWSPDQALAVAAFLERVIDAIWRAHGPEMAQALADPRPRWRPPRPRPMHHRRLRRIRDDDIPF